jgi:hypothetical protein
MNNKFLSSNNSNTTIVGTTAEINLYLTLLYLILETQRIQVSSPSDSFKQELGKFLKQFTPSDMIADDT